MKSLTEGPVYTRIWLFAIPMLAGQIIQQFYSVVDSLIVGNVVGKQALASIGASFPVLFAVISFIIGIVSGSTIIIAQYHGAGDKKKVKEAIDTMYMAACLMSVLISVPAMHFCEDIFRLMKLPPDIVPMAKTYFVINIGGLLIMFAFNATNAVLRGLGDSKTPLYFIVLSSVLNIFFDLLFVVVFQRGVAGAAYATLLATAISFILSVWYMNRYHPLFSLTLRHLQLSQEMLIKSLKLGLPSGFHQISVALSLLFIFSVVNRFGTDVIAAYSIGGRISSLAGMPAMILGTALSTFVGQNIGAGHMQRARQGLVATLVIASAITIVSSSFLLYFSENVIRAFVNDTAVIKSGVEYMHIVSWFYLCFSCMFVISGAIQGAGDTVAPMLFTLFNTWIIRIPGAWYFASLYGEKAIWWAFPVSWTIALILNVVYYLSGHWKKKILIRQSSIVAVSNET